jgi:hypothetical protein
MGRQAKPRLLITTKLRQPSYIAPETVTSKLMGYRSKQYYDRGTKEREDLKHGDSVRIRTPEGWKPAEFVQPASYPRSYAVKAGNCGREYRRNSSMLMKTREDPVVIRPDNQPHMREDPVIIRSDDRPHSATLIGGPKPSQHGNTLATATGIPISDTPQQPKSVETQPTTKRTDITPIKGSSTQSTSGRPLCKPSYLSDYTKWNISSDCDVVID